ncbi:hypothetical protein [Nocardia bhagyanarayanae]|uniref:hypothetical protein n=1 Tax=Nocardia bhagyanarayanae TaxID=1215925 RepID=UPI00319DDB84
MTWLQKLHGRRRVAGRGLAAIEPAYVLGLAAGALTLSDARTLGLIEIDGDESVVRAVFAA